VETMRSGRTLYVDTRRPEKRPREELRAALATVSKFQEHIDVILGMNLKEAAQVAESSPSRPCRPRGHD